MQANRNDNKYRFKKVQSNKVVEKDCDQCFAQALVNVCTGLCFCVQPHANLVFIHKQLTTVLLGCYAFAWQINAKREVLELLFQEEESVDENVRFLVVCKGDVNVESNQKEDTHKQHTEC